MHRRPLESTRTDPPFPYPQLFRSALGSDARRGQQVTRSLADAIQLVGINTRTGAATAIGVPRDSWVRIPGRGNDKINSAMVLGGPLLIARAVEGPVGIEPDYVMVTDFTGFRAMIRSEARRVGKACVRMCRFRWAQYH